MPIEIIRPLNSDPFIRATRDDEVANIIKGARGCGAVSDDGPVEHFRVSFNRAVLPQEYTQAELESYINGDHLSDEVNIPFPVELPSGACVMYQVPPRTCFGMVLETTPSGKIVVLNPSEPHDFHTFSREEVQIISDDDNRLIEHDIFRTDLADLREELGYPSEYP